VNEGFFAGDFVGDAIGEEGVNCGIEKGFGAIAPELRAISLFSSVSDIWFERENSK
jgi:hypothetical protein